ncbi:hypothetical protein HY990_06560 [Candidatus Micrarchaeota archaeon]|nr:hypothetical protein [Candidatus Micrarchaeota archaeon]
MDLLVPLLLNLSLPPGALPLIITALLISIVFSAFLYLIAPLLQNSALSAMAKEEIAAVIFSIILIGFWLTTDYTFNSMTSALLSAAISGSSISLNTAGGTGAGHYTISHIQLADASLEILFQKLKGQYLGLYIFEIIIGFLSTISFPIGAPVFAAAVTSFSFVPFSGLTLLSQAHTIIVEAISSLMAVVWAKQFLLYFARDTVPLLLLPLGLFLRALPITRTTGSTVIAFCFAIYFIYPLTLIFTNYLIFDIYQPADFTYTPVHSSVFKTPQDESWFRNLFGLPGGGARTTELSHSTQAVMNEFRAPDVIEHETSGNGGVCDGPALVRLLCSASNLFSAGVNAATSVFTTVFNMSKFMLGLTGDFSMTLFRNPLMPSSTTAGLYFFIVEEVGTIGPFIILITITTVIEIIFTITLFRNVSLLIGGEAEIIGLSRIV